MRPGIFDRRAIRVRFLRAGYRHRSAARGGKPLDAHEHIAIPGGPGDLTIMAMAVPTKNKAERQRAQQQANGEGRSIAGNARRCSWLFLINAVGLE
jgi:hypothetical protein